MAENSADAVSKLEGLVKQIMQETDPVKYDLLATEIWEVLGEVEISRARMALKKATS